MSYDLYDLRSKNFTSTRYKDGMVSYNWRLAVFYHTSMNRDKVTWMSLLRQAAWYNSDSVVSPSLPF